MIIVYLLIIVFIGLITAYLPGKILQVEVDKQNTFEHENKCKFKVYYFILIFGLYIAITILSTYILHYNSIIIDKSSDEIKKNADYNIGTVVINSFLENTEKLDQSYAVVAILLQSIVGIIFGFTIYRLVYVNTINKSKKIINIMIFLFATCNMFCFIFLNYRFFGFLNIIEYPNDIISTFAMLSIYATIITYWICMFQKIICIINKKKHIYKN